MKKTLVSVSLTAIGLSLLSLCAFAQEGNADSRASARPTAPPYCQPCLFYGGDFDPSNPNSNTLGNSFTDRYQAATYVPFYVPSGITWTIGGVFSNNMSTISFLDPPKVRWSISSGISMGDPGTVIASGENSATWTPTGRTWGNGFFTEYTALAKLRPEQFVTLTTGVYWLTVVPVCTGADCGDNRFYLSDVEDVPAPNHKGIEPNDDSYFVLAPLYLFAPAWGSSGVCEGGCDKFSAGLLGREKPGN